MYYNGIQSSTSIVVVVRSDSDGDCTVTLSNGDTGSVTVATATNYGYGKIELTGLTPDTLYTYTVTMPDSSGGAGECKTFSENGGEKLAFFSCEDTDTFISGGQIVNFGAKCAICLGDETYNEDAQFPTIAKAIDEAVHDAWRKGMREKPAKVDMMQKIGFGIMTDDHDTFLNNVYDDPADPPAALNVLLAAVGREEYTTAAQWTATKTAIANTLKNAHTCNPAATNTTDTDPFYFAFDCGNIRVIVPALLMRTKTDMRLAPDGTTPAMNAEQFTWLKYELNNTAKKFKLVLSQKTTTVATLDNNDSWDNYSDMDTVLQWISDNSSGFAVPGGVVFGTGDWHSPGAGAFSTANGDAYDHVVLNPCSNGQDIRDPGAYLSTTLTAIRASEIGDNRFFSWGSVESTDEYIELKAVLFDDSTYVRVRVNAGENILTRLSFPVAI